MCHKSYTSALCTMDDSGCFHVFRLGPKTSECEIIVKSTVGGCQVSNCATSLHGFNKHASSRREAVSGSRGVPRFTEKIVQVYACSVGSIVRLVHFTIPTACDFSCHSFPSYHVPGELVSTNSVSIPSIGLILQNRSRQSAFVPISLGSVLIADIVSSFRSTKS